MKRLFPMAPGGPAEGGDGNDAGPDEVRQATAFAEALEQLLEGGDAPDTRGRAIGTENEELVGTARMVRELGGPDGGALDEVTSARLKRELLQRAAEQQVPGGSGRRWRRAWVAALAAAAILIVGIRLLPDLLWQAEPGGETAATSVPEIDDRAPGFAANLRESLADAAPSYPRLPTPRALFGEPETPSDRASSHVRYGLASLREAGFQRARRAYLSATGPRAGAPGTGKHGERLAVRPAEPKRPEVEEEER